METIAPLAKVIYWCVASSFNRFIQPCRDRSPHLKTAKRHLHLPREWGTHASPNSAAKSGHKSGRYFISLPVYRGTYTLLRAEIWLFTISGISLTCSLMVCNFTVIYKISVSEVEYVVIYYSPRAISWPHAVNYVSDINYIFTRHNAAAVF